MLEYFVDHVVGPMLARHGHIERLHDLIDQAIVVYLVDRRKMSLREIGEHLGRHSNWVSSTLQKARARHAREGGLNETGVRYAIMSLLVNVHPASRSVLEIAEEIGATDARVLNTLEALRKNGLLELDGARYRAVDKNTVGSVTDRKDNVIESLATAFDIGERYTEGAPDTLFQRVDYQLSPDEAEGLLRDVRAFVRRRLTEAVTESYKRYPDGLVTHVGLIGMISLGIERRRRR
jgi:DNA-binding Lrp family transcriptional regulator